MNGKLYILKVVTVLVVIIIASMSVSAQGQVTQSQNPVLDAYDESTGLRLAEANLRLAEIELEIALTDNQKIANVHSALTIQRLRNNLACAQEMVRFESGDHSDHGLHKLHLVDLEMELQFAEANLAAAVAANKQVPGAVNDLEIKRLRAAAEVARLALEKARDPTVTQSAMDHLQWRFDRIRSELSRLYVRMDSFESRN